MQYIGPTFISQKVTSFLRIPAREHSQFQRNFREIVYHIVCFKIRHNTCKWMDSEYLSPSISLLYDKSTICRG